MPLETYRERIADSRHPRGVRQRLVQHYLERRSVSLTARAFRCDRKTVRLWVQRYQPGGGAAPPGRRSQPTPPPPPARGGAKEDPVASGAPPFQPAPKHHQYAPPPAAVGQRGEQDQLGGEPDD